MEGLYDVTPGAGQTGFLGIDPGDELPLSGTQEVLGGDEGVPKVRVRVLDGATIVIPAHAEVTLTFTPVTTRQIDTDGPVVLHAGLWTVGDDVGPGDYIAAARPGQRGLLLVSDGRVDTNLETQEFLDGDGLRDDPASIALDLNVGDLLQIVGLSELTLTPARGEGS